MSLTETVASAQELRRLAESYAIAMDTVNLDEFPRLFVPDGYLIVRQQGREAPLATFNGPGRDGIGLIALLLGELYESTLHNITSHAARINGDDATGVTYCLAYHIVAGEDGGALETLGVRYDESFVRTEAGWRFRGRDATRLWSQVTPTPRQPLLVDRAAARARQAG